MKVIVYVNYQGENLCWNDISGEKQKEIAEKLNEQTAKHLGYKRKAPKKVPVI